MRTDPKRAESLLGERSGSRYETSKEQFDGKMWSIDRNATVFNHTKGVDKETKDHRMVFHSIFTAGSGANNTAKGEGEGGML